MSDQSSGLHELPDLAGDVRERVVIPPYAEVSRRVRARRLRVAVGAMAAAVVVVAGVAVWQSVGTTAGPSIPEPAGTSHGPIPPTDESQWRAVVAGAQAHPFGISGTDDGSIAAVWRALEHPEPTFALVIREADGTVHGRRIDEPVDLTPVPGGWVGAHTGRGWFIGTDGTWTDLGDATVSRAPRPGDVLVTGEYGVERVYSPADQTWSELAMDGEAEDAYFTPDGALVTCSRAGNTHVRVTMGDVHSPWVDGSTCAIAGRGDAVSAIGLGDQPDGGIPLTGLLVRSRDGSEFRAGDFIALSGVTSVTITPAGSTLVTDASTGDSFVLSADRTQLVEPDRKLGLAFVAGDHLYATTGFMNGPLLVSDDDGRTWRQDVLPGNESKQD